jgi:hypothetical protein
MEPDSSSEDVADGIMATLNEKLGLASEMLSDRMLNGMDEQTSQHERLLNGKDARRRLRPLLILGSGKSKTFQVVGCLHKTRSLTLAMEN